MPTSTNHQSNLIFQPENQKLLNYREVSNLELENKLGR